MRSRLTAECPEDLYGPEVECPECEAPFYSGDGSECPECGYDPADDYDPPEPDLDPFIDDGPGGALW